MFRDSSGRRSTPLCPDEGERRPDERARRPRQARSRSSPASRSRGSHCWRRSGSGATRAIRSSSRAGSPVLFRPPPSASMDRPFRRARRSAKRSGRACRSSRFRADRLAAYLLTRDLFGARAGLIALFALNVTPFFFASAGSWIVPDGPLLAALAAAALALARTVLRARRRAARGLGALARRRRRASASPACRNTAPR